MSESASTTTAIDPEKVREALATLAAHRFHERMRQATAGGNQAHRILPDIWPVIEALCLIADASEVGMLEVKAAA